MKYIVLSAILLLIGGAGGLFGDYQAGRHYEAEMMQKQALAHECGALGPKTLAFSCTTQANVQLLASALPVHATKGK